MMLSCRPLVRPFLCALAATALLMLAACATATDPPKAAQKLQALPTDAIKDSAYSFELWPAYELARRYETGDRIGQDLVCAVHWYDTASTLTYAYDEWIGGVRVPRARANHPAVQAARTRALQTMAARGMQSPPQITSEVSQRCHVADSIDRLADQLGLTPDEVRRRLGKVREDSRRSADARRAESKDNSN